MNITIRAHKLVYELLNLMPSPYQRSSLKAMLALFLRAQGLALPEHASHKSPSALSRFLNLYDWPTTSVIRALRREVLQVLLERRKVGRRPILRAIVDLTPLQKSGSFEGLAGLLHILNKKRGVQLVVLYLEVDGWRVPWGFRIWRGKGSASPGTLALKLLRTLPKTLTAHYRVMVLADSGFCGAEFIEGVRRLGHHAVVGVRRDRRLTNGTRLDQTSSRGERVYLEGLAVPVYVAAYWLKRDGGREKRFVLCTKALSPKHIVRWGKKRWCIEGFFKTAKGRFSLDRFGQGSRLGVYRYLVLSLIAYLLAHWGHLSQGREGLPRWGEAARTILEEVLAETVIEGLLMEIKERRALLRSHGIEVSVDGCKI
ncbi:MAG: transposase [Rubrobacteraceae bacterium]